MSKLDDILVCVVDAQNALNLKVDGQDTTAVKRMLPKREETVDQPYQTTVSGAEQVDEVKRIAFGSRWQCLYRIELTLVTPNERDMLSDLADHAAWREATRAWYQRPRSIAVDGVKRVEIVQAPFLNRERLAAGYNYNQVVLLVTTYESRP